MPRYTRIVADLIRVGRADPEGIDGAHRARSFVARLSGVLESQGHKALADGLFALLDDNVTTVRRASPAVQAELTERYAVPDEV